MTNYDKELPVFVYGTLRCGEGNDRHWKSLGGWATPATFKGGRLYHLPYGFPAVVLDDDEALAPVVGELIEGHDHQALMKRLDMLEGFNADGNHNHYERVQIVATDEDGIHVDAWLYVYRGRRAETLTSGCDLIESGYWCEWMERVVQ